ncbi:uncharacterized protein LOC110990359 [Acanthaster planci]|uniref:Uncharacterized protein LOC110990359 n=1 Tax=Acanthaster planci TaxID=133434 RepID=A0A8B8A216_ACAPL|nr:uncharacterized protein LOC110990359 [Acanthaster planci]
MIFALALVGAGCVSSIRLGRGPETTEARAGQTVELRCDVNYRNGETILWYQNPTNSFVTFNRDVYDSLDDDRKQRYSIQGSEYWHVFNLRIANLKAVDNGHFYCGYLEGTKFRVLGSARLTVIYPPDETSPTCSINLLDESNSTTAGVGSTVDLICMWTGGNPPSTAAWYRQNVPMETRKEEGYVWTRWELTAEDNGMEFTCEMESKALSEKRSCTASPLHISPQAVIVPSVAYVRIGDTVEFECQGTGLPRITSYVWAVPPYLARNPERFELRDGNRIFHLLAVEAGDDALEITCEVRTLRGLEGTASAVLRLVQPTTLSPKTTAADTEAPPTTLIPTMANDVLTTTLIATEAKDTEPTTTEISNKGATGPKSTPASPQPSDSLPMVSLHKNTIIGIGAAASTLFVLIIAALLVLRKRLRARKSSIRRDTSMHLVNGAYETVIGGSRVIDDPENNHRIEYQTHDNHRPVAAVSPWPQAAGPSQNGTKHSVCYAKVDKKISRDSDPLYDKVPVEDKVDLGIGSCIQGREPTYINQGALAIGQEPDPREFNAEGLTYAELELERNGRLHSKKSHTVYAKLK